MDLILVAVISLGAIGLIAAVILYAASKKFAVYEDPRIAKVNEVVAQSTWPQLNKCKSLGHSLVLGSFL